MIPFFGERNNVNFLNQAYLIKAAVLSKMGKAQEAAVFFEKTVEISKSSNFVRPFVELGDALKEMLLHFKDSISGFNGIDGIYHLFPNEKVNSKKLLLSIREKEILKLSANHTNKEVGNELFISETTVKRHLSNIYKKLKTSSKQEALLKAQELNIF